MKPTDNGYPHPSSAEASRRMAANRRRDTKPEVLLRSMLHRRGLRFRCDYPVRAGGRIVRVDVAFPRHRVAVFVDGCFWHGCPEHAKVPRANRDYWARKLARNTERDREVDATMTSEGWTVLRFWEHFPSRDAAEFIVHHLATATDASFVAQLSNIEAAEVFGERFNTDMSNEDRDQENLTLLPTEAECIQLSDGYRDE